MFTGDELLALGLRVSTKKTISTVLDAANCIHDVCEELQLGKLARIPPRREESNGDSEPAPPRLAAVVEHTPKTPALLKGGWLLHPDPAGKRWIRRYVELRRPYLHLYSSEGDEVSAINLTNSRIDSQPQVAKLLQRNNVRLEVWAVYATNKAWLFACRNDKERADWIWAVDRSLFVSGGGSGPGSGQMSDGSMGDDGDE